MRTTTGFLLITGIILAVSMLFGKPPGRAPGPDSNLQEASALPFVTRMMTFDANRDGELSKDEVSDGRLLNLFERIDQDGDGVVKKEEMILFSANESVELEGNRPEMWRGVHGGPGRHGRGGFGPPGPHGPGMGWNRSLGQILPQRLQEMLDLSDDQKQKLEALQAQVDDSLQEILTDEQSQQFEAIKTDRPPGPPGFFGRPDNFAGDRHAVPR